MRAWTLDALRPLLARHERWLNLHQHCGDPSSPLEAFRLASLLSNGARVLSELSDTDDMQLYAGAPVANRSMLFNAIAGCDSSLCHC